MKKLALLLLVVTLLAACQPAATPQPTAVLPAEPPAPTAIPPTPTIDPFVEQIAENYLTTITQDDSATSPGVDAGDYLLKLQPDLRWFITDPNDLGWIGAQGYYTVTADQIVFKATGGQVIGSCSNIQNTYGWTLDGQTLTFTAVSVDDKCEGEKFFLTVHPFARESASAPTSAQVEALASSPSDLVGIWGLPDINSNLEIKADGTYRVVASYGDLIDFGNYTFDAGKFTWVNTSMCHDKPATYEVYVTTQDGKPISLRFQVVGSDPCESRKGLGIALFQNP